MTQERLRPLPVQVRSQAGEGIRAYIVRLAHANHLPSRQKAYRRRNPRAHWPKVPCKHCGKKMRVRPGQRYRLCSSACRRADYLQRKREWWESIGRGEPLTCAGCGDPVFSTTRMTCSGRCRQRVHRQRTKQPRSNPPPPPPPPPQTVEPCAVCHEPLPPGPGWLQRRTCSQRCRQKAYRQWKHE